MCEVRSRGKNGHEPNKIKKYNDQQPKKKWIVMNPIWCRMKKRSPSSGENGQLVHWWLLVHSAQISVLPNG
jgi:hypothetical protein